LGNARRGIRIWRWRRGGIEGRECLSKVLVKIVKMEVQRRENPRVRNATRGMRIWRWRRSGVGGWECLSKVIS